MSSDEGERNSPELPRDSDRGSSVSSELQDEYEELLRYAVVTPKYEPSLPSLLLSTSQLSKSSQHSTKMDTPAQTPADNEAHSSTEVTLTRATPPLEEPRPPSCISEDESMATRSVASEERSERAQTRSDRSGQSSPDALITVMSEMFISEENLNKMENILEIWSTNLKCNVMMELRKWKLAFVEQHRLELKNEREKHAALMAAVNAEVDGLKDLLNTYQISNQRKDEVIMNLSRAVDRQREKLELMRSFTHWRLQHSAAREEAQGGRLAEQHYHLQLKRKVWAGWHSLIQNRWRERVERACCARAENICMQLSAEYEAKVAQNVEELQKAQAEIQRLHTEREHYEDSMKKAFMRGVCALNIEALSMFNTGEAGRLDRDAPPPGDELSISSLANHPPRTVSSARLSPIVMETPMQLAPSLSNTEDAEMEQFVSQPGSSTVPRKETILSTTVVNSTVPPVGSTTSFRQVNTRIVTAGKQKASKTVTARLTGRAEPNRVGRPPGTLHLMGVAPPMSSIVVERHHPVTQLTVGQATAAKFPRSAHQSQTVSSRKSSSSQPRGPSTFHIQSIKVVD
ncbi:centrosomal protein POC5-like isoform X1 [Myxocyprinus asiaticus]|uniref:centrosomal protein POC5-like isoform X1 n=1 Tax=Myxocyprinus asiaticus TaxID=70543 RepID=UPI002222A640|nr:centrosomal protein POC5-like isoform X1 [Myxocyprinus asiaticus]XP_051529555.1 centrosomal protein POC5-like isoform X1 [Myxocyprinus asiaticus]